MIPAMKDTIPYRQFDKTFERYIKNSHFCEVPEYYHVYEQRYWNIFRYLQHYLEKEGRILDIGGGQFAILCKYLLGVDAHVADIDTQHTAVLEKHGVGFTAVDLSRESLHGPERYDLALMADVIEHVPTPPHRVFENLYRVIQPGGYLMITTPNFFRFRNLFRLAMGKEIFCVFRFPEKNQSLGHFMEYSKEQMDWHMKKAGFSIEISRLEQLSLSGATAFTRTVRRMILPLLWFRPLWKDHMVIIGRKSIP